MRNAAAAAGLLIVTLCCGPAVDRPTARAQQAPPTESHSIFVGQPLAAATDVLKRRDKEFHEGGFAFTLGDPDQSNLHFTLDDDHTTACVFFSKSKQVVTGISLVVFPSRLAHDKLSESWVRVTEIALYPDTTYAVRFAKPLTPDQLRRREAVRPQDVFPPGNVGGAKNP